MCFRILSIIVVGLKIHISIGARRAGRIQQKQTLLLTPHMEVL
ncbi:hypothetical protein OMAG_000459 [Candidatus Omnitrophus magneticus]|uniref:Uncharacterized protein n=1 Tax=Candidatus Omnitrophus magneticus TaxID=1609969 RepID=A0A0F0CW64_9BACT|nr:hypothetical protein OMAG_000459 [Candidatus Omnitrophus magneticus]